MTSWNAGAATQRALLLADPQKLGVADARIAFPANTDSARRGYGASRALSPLGFLFFRVTDEQAPAENGFFAGSRFKESEAFA